VTAAVPLTSRHFTDCAHERHLLSVECLHGSFLVINLAPDLACAHLSPLQARHISRKDNQHGILAAIAAASAPFCCL